MVEINLLPWRAIRRAENEKRKRGLLICVGVFLVLLGMFHCGFKLYVEVYETKIAELQAQLEELNSQTQQNVADSHLVMIKQIETNQVALLNFFKMGFQAVRDSISWTAVTSKNNNLIGEGDADSLLALSHFVKRYNLESEGLPITILNITQNTTNDSIHFRLQCARLLLPFLSQIKNDEEF